jgi:hypothetical protein
MKSGNLKFLESSGPLQACNGTAFYKLRLTEDLPFIFNRSLYALTDDFLSPTVMTARKLVWDYGIILSYNHKLFAKSYRDVPQIAF